MLMNELIDKNNFNIGDSTKTECMDFSYHYFEKLTRKEMENISFFRSDFRGSQFRNVYFYRNNLDRADFISCTFENCTFEEVSIGASEVKNCIFTNSHFEFNEYNNTSIQECYFENCTFSKEHQLVNIKNTHFKNTSFSDISFERSTTEKNIYEKCRMSNVDFATMHAECHQFISCNLQHVKLGISYVFGYLYYDTSISSFDVLYRGEKVPLDNESEARKRIEKQRLYELFNILFIYEKYNKIPRFFTRIISELVKNYNSQSLLELTNIFNALIFYSVHRVIPYDVMLDVSESLLKFDFSILPFPAEIHLTGLKEQFLFTIRKMVLDESVCEWVKNDKALLTLHIQIADYRKALRIADDFFERVSNLTGEPVDYELYQKKKGSWFLVFLVSVATLGIIPKLVREYTNMVFSIEIKHAYVIKAKKLLNKKKLSGQDLKQIAESYREMNIDSGMIESSDLINLLSEVKGTL